MFRRVRQWDIRGANPAFSHHLNYSPGWLFYPQGLHIKNMNAKYHKILKSIKFQVTLFLGKDLNCAGVLTWTFLKVSFMWHLCTQTMIKKTMINDVATQPHYFSQITTDNGNQDIEHKKPKEMPNKILITLNPTQYSYYNISPTRAIPFLCWGMTNKSMTNVAWKPRLSFSKKLFCLVLLFRRICHKHF